MSLMKKFYTDPYLHIRSFTIQLFVSIALCAAAYIIRPVDIYHFNYAPWQWALVPLGIYAGGMSAVFIHNATHHSFPNRWLNEFCGYLAGMHQLWGFFGWRLIHLVHHHYSDNVAMDPHPPGDLSFWAFTRKMFLSSSAVISARYREHWGMTHRTRILHKALLGIFFMLSVTNLLFWYLLLGPAGMLFFYVPSYIANHLLFADINYHAHPKDPATGETAPANMNHTPYYKAANAIWCGIYFHGNHHRKPALFNPRRMPARREKPQEPLKAAA